MCTYEGFRTRMKWTSKAGKKSNEIDLLSSMVLLLNCEKRARQQTDEEKWNHWRFYMHHWMPNKISCLENWEGEEAEKRRKWMKKRILKNFKWGSVVKGKASEMRRWWKKGDRKRSEILEFRISFYPQWIFSLFLCNWIDLRDWKWGQCSFLLRFISARFTL